MVAPDNFVRLIREEHRVTIKRLAIVCEAFIGEPGDSCENLFWLEYYIVFSRQIYYLLSSTLLNLVGVNWLILSLCSNLEGDLDVAGICDVVSNIWMVSAICSLIWRHLDELLDIRRTISTSQSIFFGAIVNAHGASVQLTSVVHADEAFLGTSKEPTSVNDRTWPKLRLGRHLSLIDSLPDCCILEDFYNELLSLCHRVTDRTQSRWFLRLWN